MGAVVLFAIVCVRREAIPRSGRLWVHIAVAALFANAAPHLLFAVAEQTVDSSTAGIINATTPLWTAGLTQCRAEMSACFASQRLIHDVESNVSV